MWFLVVIWIMVDLYGMRVYVFESEYMCHSAMSRLNKDDTRPFIRSVRCVSALEPSRENY